MQKNRKRLIVYGICMMLAVGITFGVFFVEAIFPLPERFSSVHSASAVQHMLGFSENSVFNTGVQKDLDALPGVGEVISQRIIELRDEIGGYRIPEDLLLVKGIGEKTMEKIMNVLTEPLVVLWAADE